MPAVPKFPSGQSLQEYRTERRTKRENAKDKVKADVRARDGQGCRWPGCEIWRKGVRVEGAHLDDMGMGGDPKNIRTQRNSLIRLCWEHHQGVRSLHTGHLDIRRETSQGTDGPCSFWHRESLLEPFTLLAIEDEATFARRHKQKFYKADDELEDEVA